MPASEWTKKQKVTVPFYLAFQSGEIIELSNGDLLISHMDFAPWGQGEKTTTNWLLTSK